MLINFVFLYQLLIIWIANDPKIDLGFYDQDLKTFTTKLPFQFSTQAERMAAWKQVKPRVEKYMKGKLLKQKQEEIQRLRKEIELLA